MTANKLNFQKNPAELLEINSSQFNQKAKELLRKLGLEVSAEHLYSLQLALHGLQTMKTEGWMQEYQPDAISQVEQMLGWNPEMVQPWIRWGGDPDERATDESESRSEALLAEQTNPQEAAEELGMNMWENLMEIIPALSPPVTED